jgi:hypothetical protein
MAEERQLRIAKVAILTYLNMSNFFLVLDIITTMQQEFSLTGPAVYGEVPYQFPFIFPVYGSILGIQSFLIYLTLSFLKTRVINLPLFMNISNITVRSRK